ncbi:hypothetical protein SASPL_119440 [Salvia splendens]|uniref:AB hydrolase-1 domain-containing protein n=2 Tax=Salvia splendens TaxID=180675 RepID=A0A8X8XTJ8_SALSN|nr:uncharacterized protein LOC121811212 isoform X1 [Salvia splendens]XP_042067956.1 uncharacterized protein LOC121811212 isoform X1 [Salvia splendens]KAG6417286.1 hypothetical protein SASPL_119440 [Salvia splendens]
MVFKKVAVLMMRCLGISKQPTLPAPPAETAESSSIDVEICGSKGIRLSDGRFLAYTERGVPMNKSNYTVIVVHGFGSSKEMNFMASQDFLEELKICLLLFDRAGYGESDPNPKRSLKSEASDIEELADKLQLGSKFFVLGVSLGCYPVWGCLRRTPNRLAGVALVVPYINYKWPSLPSDLTKDDYRKGLSHWAVFVASHAPRLLYWWLTQKLFPSSTVLDRNPAFFSRKDIEVLKITPGYQLLSQNKVRDRTVFDSLRRDFVVAFGKWDFDPLELCNPYPQRESTVHIWQGHEDKVVPVQLQRHVSGKLPWIRYHEVPDGGHLLVYDSDVCEAILRSLVLGEDPPQMYRPQC